MAIPSQQEALMQPPPSSRPASNITNKEWGPYSSAGDFSANMAITLVVVFCALLFALSLTTVIRFLLFSRRRGHPPSPDDPEKQEAGEKDAASPAETVPTLVFSAGAKLAGGEAECAICLAEFVEGDQVRVLPACNHGFHVRCVQRWLASRQSCPTCRTSCLVAAAAAAAASGGSGVEDA